MNPRPEAVPGQSIGPFRTVSTCLPCTTGPPCYNTSRSGCDFHPCRPSVIGAPRVLSPNQQQVFSDGGDDGR